MIKTWETDYLNLCEDILKKGDDRSDRTGVGTRALFGRQLRIPLSANAFPAMTTKKLMFNAMKAELLWFITGSGDERDLAEITWGHREGKKTIWTPNAQSDYWLPKASNHPGDAPLGRVYGTQWRGWRTYKPIPRGDNDTQQLFEEGEPIDQVAELVHKLKTNPSDRRMIISAWNVGELDQMALPPCHMMAQFFVAGSELSCMMTQRSVDVFLGLPFNIASYALFTHMLAQCAGLGVGELIMNLGDTHIYHNHFEQVKEQLKNEPYAPPKLWLNESVNDIFSWKMEDISLVDGTYKSHNAISAVMAV